MRILSHPIVPSLVAALAVLGLVFPASAGSFYKWETDSGGIAFTDDPKQIPARYKDQAETVVVRKLDDFERFTPMARSEPPAYAARLDQRLGYLRDLNARTVSPHAVTAPQAPQGVAIRSGADEPSIESYVGTGGEGPVIVETVRSRPDGSPVTRHITIVRRGDQILSVIKPEQLHSKPRALDERSLEID